MESRSLRLLGSLDLVIGYGGLFVGLPLSCMNELSKGMSSGPPLSPPVVFGPAVYLVLLVWIGWVIGLIVGGHMLRREPGRGLAWMVGLASLLIGSCQVGLENSGLLPGTVTGFAISEIFVGMLQLLLLVFAGMWRWARRQGGPSRG